MKKTILILIVLAMVTGLVPGENKKTADKSKKPTFEGMVTKTYILKHISPRIVESNLRLYYYRSSYDSNGNMITIKIFNHKIKQFEELLKKLDTEKKTIFIRIFTVIASNQGKSDDIKNRDLKNVLSELKKILSFKSYRLDGVSALTVMDGQKNSRLILTSSQFLELRIEGIKLIQTKLGQRSIDFSFILKGDLETHRGRERKDLISSKTSIKENGYLVAGISKIGKNGDSLVLVINAQIK